VLKLRLVHGEKCSELGCFGAKRAKTCSWYTKALTKAANCRVISNPVEWFPGVIPEMLQASSRIDTDAGAGCDAGQDASDALPE
jgi:hypothetical protein